MVASFSPGTGARVKRPRALIVDDERDALDLYEDYLRREGWDVWTAETGDDALVIAPIYLPDVIVMDLAMPGLDGFQTMLRLKCNVRTTRIPIVVLTGMEGVARRAERIGATFVLVKPCSGDALKAALQAVVRSPPGHLGG